MNSTSINIKIQDPTANEQLNSNHNKDSLSANSIQAIKPEQYIPKSHNAEDELYSQEHLMERKKISIEATHTKITPMVNEGLPQNASHKVLDELPVAKENNTKSKEKEIDSSETCHNKYKLDASEKTSVIGPVSKDTDDSQTISTDYDSKIKKVSGENNSPIELLQPSQHFACISESIKEIFKSDVHIHMKSLMMANMFDNINITKLKRQSTLINNDTSNEEFLKFQKEVCDFSVICKQYCGKLIANLKTEAKKYPEESVKTLHHISYLISNYGNIFCGLEQEEIMTYKEMIPIYNDICKCILFIYDITNNVRDKLEKTPDHKAATYEQKNIFLTSLHSNVSLRNIITLNIEVIKKISGSLHKEDLDFYYHVLNQKRKTYCNYHENLMKRIYKSDGHYYPDIFSCFCSLSLTPEKDNENKLDAFDTFDELDELFKIIMLCDKSIFTDKWLKKCCFKSGHIDILATSLKKHCHNFIKKTCMSNSPERSCLLLNSRDEKLVTFIKELTKIQINSNNMWIEKLISSFKIASVNCRKTIREINESAIPDSATRALITNDIPEKNKKRKSKHNNTNAHNTPKSSWECSQEKQEKSPYYFPHFETNEVIKNHSKSPLLESGNTTIIPLIEASTITPQPDVAKEIKSHCISESGARPKELNLKKTSMDYNITNINKPHKESRPLFSKKKKHKKDQQPSHAKSSNTKIKEEIVSKSKMEIKKAAITKPIDKPIDKPAEPKTVINNTEMDSGWVVKSNKKHRPNTYNQENIINDKPIHYKQNKDETYTESKKTPVQAVQTETEKNIRTEPSTLTIKPNMDDPLIKKPYITFRTEKIDGEKLEKIVIHENTNRAKNPCDMKNETIKTELITDKDALNHLKTEWNKDNESDPMMDRSNTTFIKSLFSKLKMPILYYNRDTKSVDKFDSNIKEDDTLNLTKKQLIFNDNKPHLHIHEQSKSSILCRKAISKWHSEIFFESSPAMSNPMILSGSSAFKNYIYFYWEGHIEKLMNNPSALKASGLTKEDIISTLTPRDADYILFSEKGYHKIANLISDRLKQVFKDNNIDGVNNPQIIIHPPQALGIPSPPKTGSVIAYEKAYNFNNDTTHYSVDIQICPEDSTTKPLFEMVKSNDSGAQVCTKKFDSIIKGELALIKYNSGGPKRSEKARVRLYTIATLELMHKKLDTASRIELISAVNYLASSYIPFSKLSIELRKTPLHMIGDEHELYGATIK